MERHAALVAGALTAVLVVGLAATFVVDPELADRLTREDAAVEWLQAALLTFAGVSALRAAWDAWRVDASPVFEVLAAAMMAGLIIGEVDLDRLVVGRKIISTRFLVDARVSVGWRALAVFVMALPPIALAIYALRRRRELLTAIRRATAKPWGRVFIAGVIVFGLTATFEKPLGRIPGLPRYMVEEVLELVAAICFAVGLYARSRRAEEKALSSAESRCAPPS